MTLFTWWFLTVDITTYQIDGELVHQVDIFSHGTSIIPNASFVYGLNYYCLVLLQSGHYSPQHVVAFMDGEECNSAWYHTHHTRQKPLSPPWLPELIGCGRRSFGQCRRHGRWAVGQVEEDGLRGCQVGPPYLLLAAQDSPHAHGHSNTTYLHFVILFLLIEVMDFLWCHRWLLHNGKTTWYIVLSHFFSFNG